MQNEQYSDAKLRRTLVYFLILVTVASTGFTSYLGMKNGNFNYLIGSSASLFSIWAFVFRYYFYKNERID